MCFQNFCIYLCVIEYANLVGKTTKNGSTSWLLFHYANICGDGRTFRQASGYNEWLDSLQTGGA